MRFLKTRAHDGERLDSVAKLYLANKFFGALYFSYPIFYEYASQTITPIQVGLFFSAIGICGLIAEIPTGTLADKHSRKCSALIGMMLLIIAPLVVFFGHTFASYLVAALFYGVGGAFFNGTLDSLVYDHKNVTKKVYRTVNAREITYGQAGILVSAASGGLLFSMSQGLPFMVQATAGLICLFLIARMHESHKEGHVKPALSHLQLFVQSAQYLFATPFLRAVVLMGVIFSVMLGMSIQFVHEATMIERGLTPALRGFLISGTGVTVLIVLNLFLLKLLKTDTKRIIYMGVGALVAYALMSLGYTPLFLFGYLLWTCLNATSSFIRLLLHDRIPSSHRSTVMSSFKTLAILVGLCASTGTGVLVQWAGTPRAAYLLFAIISFAVLLPCAFWLVTHLKRAEVGLPPGGPLSKYM